MASPAKRNIASGYANFGVMAVLGLIVNPYLVSFLGVSAFGIWKAAQRFLDFASVADGRSSQALKWVIAFRSGRQDDERHRRDVGAALLVWLLWLPVLIVVSAGITLALPSLIKGVTGSETRTVYLLGGILCANLVLTGLLWLPDSVLVGTNQGYRSMIVTTIVVGGSNVAMVASARLGHNVVALAVILLIANVLNGAITYLVARRHVRWLGISRPDRGEVKSLLGFSGWILVWGLVTRLFQSSELILFSALVGAVAVTNYTFTSYVVTFALQIGVITTSGLMPQLGASLGRHDMDRARSLVADSKQMTLAVVVIAGSGVLLFNRDFVTLWAGSGRYLGNTVNALMVVAFVQLAFIRSDDQIQDTGISIRAKVLIGSLGAGASIGVACAVFAATHRVVLMYLGLIATRGLISVIFPALVRRLVPGVQFNLRAHLIGGVILAASYVIGLHLNFGNLFELAIAIVLGSGVLGILTLWLLVTPAATYRIMGKRYRSGGRHRRGAVGRESSVGLPVDRNGKPAATVEALQSSGDERNG